MADQKELKLSVRVVGRVTEKLEEINKKLERLTRPIAKINEHFRFAERSVRKYTNTLDQLARKFRGIGTAATLGLTLPIAAFGATTVKTAADFEHSMTKVRTLTQGDMFDQLKSQAREFGATTRHSATEAAKAMAFYSMAGFKALETFKTMPSTLALATAATEDLSTTADILSGVVRGYQIPLDDIPKTTDMLTAGFANAKMDLRTLGEALQKSGGTFNKLGVPLSELLALIGKLRDVNIDPSSIGTALTSAASRLVSPVKLVKERIQELLNIDASKLTTEQGKLGSFVDLLERLEKAGATPADFYDIFGKESGKYLIQYLQVSSGIRKLQHTIKNSTGITKRFAKEFEKGATGAMYSFKSAVEAVEISLGESGLLDYFTKSTFAFASYIQNLSRVNPALLNLATIAAVTVGIIGPMFLALATMVSTLAASIVALKFASVVAAAFGTTLLTVLGGIAFKIGLVVGAIGLVVYVGWFFYKNWSAIYDFAGKVVSGWVDLVSGYMSFVWGLIKDYLVGWFKALLWFADFLEKLWDNPKQAFIDTFEDIKNKVSEVIDTFTIKFMRMVDKVMPYVKRIMNFLIDPKGNHKEFYVAIDQPDYPSIQNEEVVRKLRYDMGPIRKLPNETIDFNYKPNSFIPEPEKPKSIDLVPDFIDSIGSTIYDAFSKPTFDITDDINIDIDENKLGKAMKIDAKIDAPKQIAPVIPLKSFGPGDFFKSSQIFDDRSIKGEKQWNPAIPETKVVPLPTSKIVEPIENVSRITTPEAKMKDTIATLKQTSEHKFEEGRVERIMDSSTTREERIEKSEKEVRIVIDFENAPKGVEVRTENKSKVPLSVNMGFAMDGNR